MITASEFHTIMNASPAALERLANKKLGEKQGNKIPQIKSYALDWGVETETQGLAMISLHPEIMTLGEPLEHPELQIHPDYFFIGASPDGFIGKDYGIELKCPYKTQVHRKTLRYGMPLKHMAQVQGGMWVTGRKFWFFASFDPRLLGDNQGEDALYLKLVERDEAYIENMATHILNFWALIETQFPPPRLDPTQDPIPRLF